MSSDATPKMRELIRTPSANSGSLSASRRRNFSTVGIGALERGVPSAISMTLHPANVQDAHRTPVPDVSVGRARVEGDGRTYVYASVRPVGPIRSRSTVTSFAVPSPIAHSFHVCPRCDARELSNPEAFATTPVPPPATCSMPAATLLVVRVRESRGSILAAR